ncbi:MAG TPA: hypothetical protein VEJ21_05090, partial [Acidimicrobiales bacterium]|nr:hypothetical protein [Acidimicrobiales bacterium]
TGRASSGLRASAAVCAVACTLTALLLLAVLGLWWAELLLVPVVCLLAYAWWDAIALRLERSVAGFAGRIDGVGRRAGRVGRRGLVRARWRARMAGLAVGGWAAKRRAEARLLMRRLRIHRRHERALQQLGRAVYAEDAVWITSAKAQAVETGAQLEQTGEELRRTRAEVQRRIEREHRHRDATARLQLERPELLRSGGLHRGHELGQ